MQTGPKTPEGKAASSMNATKHGLTAHQVVLPGEEAAAYERLLKCLFEDHRPASATEALLVEEMAQAHWRLNRVRSCQDQAFASGSADAKSLALLLRYSTTYERSFFKALETLKKLQRERQARTASNAIPAKPAFVSQKQHDAALRLVLEEMNAPPKPKPASLDADPANRSQSAPV